MPAIWPVFICANATPDTSKATAQCHRRSLRELGSRIIGYQ